MARPEPHDSYDALQDFVEWCEQREIFPAEYRADGKRVSYFSWNKIIEDWQSENAEA